MSTWGPGLFSSDLSADVRDVYRDFLEDQVPDGEATARTIERFDIGDDPEDCEMWLALAATQHKLGRLDDAICERAIQIIDSGDGEDRWRGEGGRELSRRRTILAKLRDQLTGPQPPRRTMRKPRRRPSDLTAGMVLAYSDPNGDTQRIALWRVLRVRASRTADTPILGWLAWDGDKVPEVSELESLAVRNEQTLTQPGNLDEDPPAQPLERPATYAIRQRQADDWRSTGFQHVATVEPHAGDDEAEEWFGMDWRGLAFTASYHLKHR